MRTRLTRFALLLIALLLPATSWAERRGRPAAKPPRLGSFTGTATGESGVSAATARFTYRPARGKLYCEMSSPRSKASSARLLTGAKPNLRQSFDVVSDKTTATGIRVIQYVRPTSGGSARFNERKLTEFFGTAVKSQAGSGTIRVGADGLVRWDNVGTLVAVRPTTGKKSVATHKWTERFLGDRSSARPTRRGAKGALPRKRAKIFRAVQRRPGQPRVERVYHGNMIREALANASNSQITTLRRMAKGGGLQATGFSSDVRPGVRGSVEFMARDGSGEPLTLAVPPSASSRFTMAYFQATAR